MNLKGIDHVGVVVDDLGRAEETFAGLGLGVTEVVKLPHVEGRFYPAGDGSGASIELVEFVEGEERDQRLGTGARARIDHIAFAVEDLESIVQTLEALGMELTGPPLVTEASTSVWTKPESSGGVMFQFIQRK